MRNLRRSPRHMQGSWAQPVNPGKDSAGSDVPLVRSHLSSERIFVLDTENLCSISISEEMGPGAACFISHLSPLAVPRLRRLFAALRRRLLM